MDFAKQIGEELNLNYDNVSAAISLLDEGFTVPFIARYRKDKTGGLSDENMRELEERLSYLRQLEERKKTIYASLKEQNIEDEKLFKAIDEALVLSELEDIYRPYKPKKLTRATKAKKAGLEPLSIFILEDKNGTLDEEAKKYVCEEYDTPETCVQGALDILAENISDKKIYRDFIKDLAWKRGVMQVKKNPKSEVLTYDNYAEYSRMIKQLKGYNVLAINRGEKEKVLSVKLVYEDENILQYIQDHEIPKHSLHADLLKEMIDDSYSRLIKPSVDNDIRGQLTDTAEDEAINTFKLSLKEILLYPPLGGRKIIGFDPGFHNGCKIAVIDENGNVLSTCVLKNPFMNDFHRSEAKKQLISLLRKYSKTVALGNGTASRESEKLLKEIKKENDDLKDMDIIIVSESGASIYSVTKLAQKEFPDFEPNLRSAVSIARRLQDPLSELVKIPPESIGVGQYQYDVNHTKLVTALQGVVEDCVNYVGVNLNTASAELLSYVSGINSKIASSIVDYRSINGKICSRAELLKVPYLKDKAFTNCAGFLRVYESEEELDNTAVHPESYPIAKKIIAEFSKDNTLKGCKEELLSLDDKRIESLSKKLDIGFLSLKDIVSELIKPSRDPRKQAVVAKLDENITDIKDLKIGMVLEGTVRNIAQFGIFVDLGVEINGLVHISEVSDTHFVSDLHQEVSLGDIIKVKIIEIDMKRNRISLSMKGLKK